MDSNTPGINLKAVKAEYKRIIANQPGVGGTKNNLIMGLYLAAYFMAVYKTALKKMTDGTFGKFIDAICISDIFVKMNKGRTLTSLNSCLFGLKSPPYLAQ